jgi:NAD(P)-dependent dehydrogenase (short-subunit alcohol dehydrogenase family)
MMALNLRGTFACATEAARLMRASGTKGRIIVIGSIVQQGRGGAARARHGV